MPNSSLAKLQNWSRTALLSCLFVTMTSHWDEAAACLGPTLEFTPFFDDFAIDIDEPVAVQITVIGLLESKLPPRLVGRASFNVLARVDRVLKGSLDRETIKIVAPGSSCDRPFVVGSAGIVMGKPVLDENGMIELHIISQSVAIRMERQK